MIFFGYFFRLVKSPSLAQKRRRRRRRRRSPKRARKGRGLAPSPAQAPVPAVPVVPAGPAVPVQVRARRGRFLVSSLLRFFRSFKWMQLPFKSKFFSNFFREFGT